MSLDIYTPWREPAANLARRHVGREDELRAAREAITAHLAGKHGSHLFLFGPRGMGKSHLLAMLRAEADAASKSPKLRVHTVGEDIPALRTADELVRRLTPETTGPAWDQWEPVRDFDASRFHRHIVFIEALDRQLGAMPELERKRLRHIIQASELLVIATGITLPDTLTKRDTAFYGFFSTWPLESLTSEESAALLDSQAGDEARKLREWPARRQALISLAGGSPRTLVALSASCRETPNAWASDHLESVVRQFTAHYQLRFRDLSPVAQELLELLARAPKLLTPQEMATLLGKDPRAVSTTLRRMADDGVVRSRSEGRQSFYEVCEPLFRFWHEYRNAPWSETRVGWLAHLIEAILQPSEIVELWHNNPDPVMRGAAARILARAEANRMEGCANLIAQWADDVLHNRPLDRSAFFSRLNELSVDGAGSSCLILHAVLCLSEHPERPDWEKALADHYRTHGEYVLAAISDFCADTLAHGPTRGALRTLLAQLKLMEEQLHRPTIPGSNFHRFGSIHHAVSSVLAVAENRGSNVGRPWVLTPNERRLLGATPGLRACFLTQGKRRTDPPLLSVDDIVVKSDDLPDVLGLAAAAHELQNANLFQRVAYFAPGVICPKPAIPAATASDTVTMSTIEPSTLSEFAPPLTWAATWSTASEGAFSALAKAHDVLESQFPGSTRPNYLRRDITTALTAFALRTPERADQLAAVLQGPLADELNRARSVARAVHSATSLDHLQPELRQLAELTLGADERR